MMLSIIITAIPQTFYSKILFRIHALTLIALFIIIFWNQSLLEVYFYFMVRNLEMKLITC